MPPCGAREVVPNTMASEPVTAEPIVEAVMMRTRVGRRERDGTLGDEGEPEQPGRLAVLPLRLGEQVRAERRGECHRQGATMPAAMTAAMIFSGVESAAVPAVASPAVPKK